MSLLPSGSFARRGQVRDRRAYFWDAAHVADCTVPGHLLQGIQCLGGILARAPPYQVIMNVIPPQSRRDWVGDSSRNCNVIAVSAGCFKQAGSALSTSGAMPACGWIS
jgi:hypothetical protein